LMTGPCYSSMTAVVDNTHRDFSSVVGGRTLDRFSV
jgi:hypothetical protein